jgi:aromatic-L-amino-acid/L-tryptophan decarboxylase
MTDVRGDHVSTDRLALPAEEMRRIGYATVDALVELATGTPPVLRTATPAEMRERIGGPPPEHGRPYDEVLATMLRDVLPYRSTLWHPGYFAYIPGSTTWPGVMGDLLTSAANLDVGNWMESAGPTQVELEVLGWMRDWVGFPAGSGGILVSGGSAANLTALACARELRLGAMDSRAVAYCSDQSHSSVARAARTLGFRPEQLRVLPTDERYRMRVDALVAAVEADVAAGRVPLLVAANAGATNTGAVDPLEELAAACAEHRLWLHVDAAYGGFAVLTERGRRQLRGIELADSVTLDPHKWLYQSIECGALLVREPRALERAFSVTPDYLSETEAADAEVQLAARGLQLTRSSHALKVWMSVQTLGLAAFRDTIDRCLDLAELAERLVCEDDRLELMMPATLGIVCLRRRFPGADESELAARNAALVASLASSGRGMVSSTRLHGHFAIRMCVLNHGSGERDVRAVLEHLATSDAGAVPPVRQLDAERVPARGPQARRVDGAAVDHHPAVVALSDAARARVHAEGREVRVPAGEVVVQRWAADRDFYLVLDGDLAVDVDGAPAPVLTSGDFFGELAARDWGSGFGYPRLATVTAASKATLWRLPPELFVALRAGEDRFADLVDAAARDRLSRS